MLSDDEQLLESVISRFEDGWNPDLFPNITGWIEENAPQFDGKQRKSLLVELIKIDLEMCWRKADIPATLDRYIALLPEVTFDLAVEEYLVRHRWGDAPDLTEYEARFGKLGYRMSQELQDTKRVECTPNSIGASPIPNHIGRYQILRIIGEGGFGRVYLAQDPVLQRYVAIKVTVQNPQFDEGATSASLTHPAFVRVFDVLPIRGSTCIVMEYVNGCTFADWLKSPEFTMANGLSILAEVAEALAALHANGLVHCDMKAPNILIDADGRPRITDFGLAIQREFQRATLGNDVCGSPAYMSPEQVRGELRWLDGRTDIWGLGVLMYQTLTRRFPFRADTPEMMFDRILYDEPPQPSSLNSNVSSQLEEVCLRCLRKRLSERWPTCEELANQIRRVGEPSPTRTSQTTQSPTRDTTELDPSLPPDQPIVGREDELAACLKAIGQESNQLLTLHGPGGIGKTTLAAMTARRVQGFDCVLFLELSAQRNGESLRNAMSAKLGIEGNDDNDLSIITAIRPKLKTLIILDNFEQLVPDGLAVLKLWLAQLLGCKFLVTSRVRLGIPQESVLATGPLGLEPEKAELSESAKLFVSVASRIDSEFQTQSNEHVIEQICRRLDGIPLGIELAAARVSILEPDQILSLLQANQSVGRSDSSVPRHRTLTEAVKWSIDLLSEVDRRTLETLALLPVGCLVKDIDDVLKTVVNQPLDRIQRLRDHSLVRVISSPYGKRVSLYQPVRDVVLSENDAQEHRQMFTEAYVAKCAKLSDLAEDRPDLKVAQQLFSERENLFSILDFAIGTSNNKIAYQTVACLKTPLRLHGMYTVLDSAIRRLDESALQATHPSLAARFKILDARNQLDLGNSEGAERLVLAALDLARNLQQTDVICEGQLLLAELSTTRGDLTLADSQSTALRNNGNLTDRQRFDVCMLLAQIKRRSGQFEVAARVLDEAAEIGQRHANDVMLSAVSRRKGNLEVSRGNLPLAIDLLKESEQISHRSDAPTERHLALTSQGVALCELGEFKQALDCFDLAQSVATELGAVRSIAVNEGNRGIALAELGDFVGAIDCYLRAETLNEQLNRASAIALNRSNRAVAIGVLGDLDEAIKLCRSGYEMLCDCGDDVNAAVVRFDLGILLHCNGAHHEAADELSAACERAEQNQVPMGMWVSGQIALAESLRKTGLSSRADEIESSLWEMKSRVRSHLLLRDNLKKK